MKISNFNKIINKKKGMNISFLFSTLQLYPFNIYIYVYLSTILFQKYFKDLNNLVDILAQFNSQTSNNPNKPIETIEIRLLALQGNNV